MKSEDGEKQQVNRSVFQKQYTLFDSPCWSSWLPGIDGSLLYRSTLKIMSAVGKYLNNDAIKKA